MLHTNSLVNSSSLLISIVFNFTWQGSLIHFSPAQRALDGDRAKPDCHGTTLVSASPIENIANWNAAGERRDCASTCLSINARLWTKYLGTRSLPIIYLLPQRMHQIQKYFSTRLTSCYIAKKGDAIRPRPQRWSLRTILPPFYCKYNNEIIDMQHSLQRST